MNDLRLINLIVQRSYPVKQWKIKRSRKLLNEIEMQVNIRHGQNKAKNDKFLKNFDIFIILIHKMFLIAA